jgi:ribose 1,5-bisphosphokinase PhnN
MNPKSILIGLAGPAGAGKDTVADYLVEKHSFQKLSFAGPLKAMLAAGGMPEPQDRALKELAIPGFDFSWRQAAQSLGTEWGRELDPDLWIKLVEKRIASIDNVLSSRGSRIVLSDVRFVNEAEMINRMGGSVVHILGRQADLGLAASHVSEAKLMIEDQDLIIDNRGDIEQLHAEIEEVMYAVGN